MWLFRWYVFYPVAALVAAGVVLVSFGPGLKPKTGALAIAGRIAEDSLVITGEDLAAPQPTANTVFFVPRDEHWDAKGLRVAIQPSAGALDAAERGVQILLQPRTADWLGSGALRIEATTLPLPLASATELAFGVVRGDRVEWRMKRISPVRDTLVFEFPAAADGARATSFALRPISEDDTANRGVEISAIRVRRIARVAAPAPPAPAPSEAPAATPS